MAHTASQSFLPEGFSIRSAVAADARALAEMHVASWKETYQGLISDSYLDSLSMDIRQQAWKDHLAHPSVHTLLLKQGKVLVGFVSYGPSRDKDAGKYTGEIYGIYLLKRVWRKGYGEMMMSMAMAALVQEGYTQATLWVLENNQRAISFYLALGFSADGTHKIEKRAQGVELHEARYRRALNGTNPW